MATEQIDGVSIYNFPRDRETVGRLSWMGNDYVRYLVEGLVDGFGEEAPGAKVVVIECEELPEFISRAAQRSNNSGLVAAVFKLSLTLRDRDGVFWQLRGISTNTYSSSSEKVPALRSHHFSVESLERAGDSH
jgi:hypothetical protein